MKKLYVYRVLSALVLALFSSVGCDRSSAPPPALSAAELPEAIEKAFAKAKPEVKELATQVASAIQAKDYAKAFQGVQNLGGMPSLTKQQASVISSALVTVNALVQEAQSQGDTKAAQTIQNYRVTK